MRPEPAPTSFTESRTVSREAAPDAQSSFGIATTPPACPPSGLPDDPLPASGWGVACTLAGLPAALDPTPPHRASASTTHVRPIAVLPPRRMIHPSKGRYGGWCGRAGRVELLAAG